MDRSVVEEELLLKPTDHSNRTDRVCGSHRLLVTLVCLLVLLLCIAHQSSMGSTMVCMTQDAPPHHHDCLNHTDVLTNTTTDGDNASDQGEGKGGGGRVNSSLPFSVVINSSSSSSSSSSSTLTRSACLGKASALPPNTYDWDKTTQGWIHSSLFIGYYVVQLPSGLLASRYGGKRVIICGLLASSVAQLVTPWAASVGVVWLCTVRALCGVAAGFLYAPVYGILANWVPTPESSLLLGIAGTGMEMSSGLLFLMSALTCELDVLGGWRGVYYIIGGLALLTALLFYVLVSDIPSQNRWVSERECHYIETVIGQAGGHGHRDPNSNAPLTNSIPVWRILTSVPVWAITVSQLGSDWFFYFLITVMPSFMKEVMHMSNAMNSLLIALPFLGVIFTNYVTGSTADWLRSRNILSTITVRKLSDFIAKVLPGALLVAMTFLRPGQEVLFSVMFVLAYLFFSFVYLSWLVNPLDLSPAYTGFITSVNEMGALWTAVVVPLVVENMTTDKTAEQWRYMMYVTFGVQVVTFIFYLIFGSSELQPWGRPDTDPAVSATVDQSSDTEDFTSEDDPTMGLRGRLEHK